MKRLGKDQVWKFTKVFGSMLAVLFFMDMLLGRSFDYMLRRQRSGMFFRANYIIRHAKEDILVFGSSRASHHYDPSIFRRRLSVSFYNCGQDAQGLVNSCAMVTAVLKRYNPKLVIIDINPTEFTTSETGKLNLLLPYHKYPVFRKFIAYNSKYESLKLISNIYPYNSQLGALILGLDAKREWLIQNGYLPLKGIYHGKPALINEHLENIKHDKVKMLEEVLTMLEQKGVRCLLVTSPVYGKVNNTATDSVCNALASRFLFTNFISYCNNEEYSRKTLFNDNYHLNNNGVAKFSDEFARIISLTDYLQ